MARTMNVRAFAQGWIVVVALTACGEAHGGDDSSVTRIPAPRRDAGSGDARGFAGADQNQPPLTPALDDCDPQNAIDPSTARAEWVLMEHANDIRFSVLPPAPFVPGNYQLSYVETSVMHWFDVSEPSQPFTLLIATSTWPLSTVIRLSFRCFGANVEHKVVTFSLDTSHPSDSGPVAVTLGPEPEDAGPLFD